MRLTSTQTLGSFFTRLRHENICDVCKNISSSKDCLREYLQNVTRGDKPFRIIELLFFNTCTTYTCIRLGKNYCNINHRSKKYSNLLATKIDHVRRT